MEMQY